MGLTNNESNLNSMGSEDIVDKIMLVAGMPDGDETHDCVPEATGQKILERIPSDMAAYMWQKSDVSAEPASFRGIGLYYRDFVTGNPGVGIEMRWNKFFDETPEGIYEQNNITYAVSQLRYSNEYPVQGSNYYFNIEGNVITFAGAGFGAMYSLQTTNPGLYSFDKRALHFAIRTEIGAIVDLGIVPAVNFNLIYFQGFKAGDLPSREYFTINAG